MAPFMRMTAVNSWLRCSTKYEDHSIDLMSIGAGTGSFVDKIVEKCGDNLKSIFCIEPNPTHIEQLRQRALGWKNITTEIDTGYFGEKYETAKLFDVILIGSFNLLHETSN